MKLKKYLELKRGNAAKLARDIDVHAPDVSDWAAEVRPIPIRYGAPIEIATGGKVTRKEMFPNDWKTVWPELVEAA
jgi:DNA-binding transcriptional regulator YdaS (Cro superfamily)